MHFHLAHIVPNKSLHGLNGYKDVIDTVEWGLVQLGHTVSYGVNEVSRQGRNIIFGAQMLDPALLQQLPGDTIVYNFEQGRNVPVEKLVAARPQLKIAAQRFEIWDYTEANMPMWKALGALRAEVVPVGYAPVLQRVPRAESQDIDVLIYGVPGPGRLAAFEQLCQSGLTCMFVCGLYGKARDDLIGRSKVVLNVSLYVRSNIFETVRVSYLMANRKAVVGVLDEDTIVDADIAKGFRACRAHDMVGACMELVENDQAREDLENAALQAISRRDIRPILAEVID